LGYKGEAAGKDKGSKRELAGKTAKKPRSSQLWGLARLSGQEKPKTKKRLMRRSSRKG